MKKREDAPKCPSCTYPTEWYTLSENVAMRRLYMKHSGKWIGVAWVCPCCGTIRQPGDWKPIRACERHGG